MAFKNSHRATYFPSFLLPQWCRYFSLLSTSAHLFSHFPLISNCVLLFLPDPSGRYCPFLAVFPDYEMMLGEPANFANSFSISLSDGFVFPA